MKSCTHEDDDSSCSHDLPDIYIKPPKQQKMREKHMGTEEKHDYQVDLVGNLITSIYEALEEDQSDMRRTTRLAQIRAAIGKSLSPHFTLGVVAEALGLHRDTVCLHNKNHEENISKWEGYEETLLISSSIIGSRMEKETKLTNIDMLTKRISRLTKARKILKKQLNNIS